MNVIPLLAVFFTFVLLQQSSTGLDIVVLKFRCGLHETRSSMISSINDPTTAMNEPITMNQTSKNESQRVKNRRDIQERGAELRSAETTAALSNQPSSTIYFYRIQIRNAGTKPIRSFAWQYQAGEEPSSTDRQFYCVLNAKPNDKKEIELLSPLAPSRVVDASKPIEKPDAEKKASVVINKVEYIDGTVWHREGWDLQTFAAEDAAKVGSGKCLGI